MKQFIYNKHKESEDIIFFLLLLYTVTMCDPTNSIAKLFETTNFSELQISKLVEWLKKTPKITTIRVNSLRKSVNDVKTHISAMLKELPYLPTVPEVELFDSIPEMILIHSIDENAISYQPRTQCREVIVDASCAAAVLRGSHIYSPGVMAMQSNTQLDEIVNIYVDIEGRCKKGTNIVYESSQKVFIGIGQVKMQRHQLYGIDACMKGIAIEVHETISCVPSIGCDYLNDQFSLLQNFPSIVCGRVINPQPNENVLDMCASPGNKTTHLAELMHDTGRLIALDKSAKRVSILKENVQRFKLECVKCFTFDATKAISNTPKNDWTPPFAKETFDKILLDAPCSGLGNRPILATKVTPKLLASFPKLQKKLLEVAIQLLKVGGNLVYSTCSILNAENELNVAWLLQKYGDHIVLETASPVFGGTGLCNAGLTDDQRPKVQRFGPNLDENSAYTQTIDSTGFFICKFRKISPIK